MNPELLVHIDINDKIPNKVLLTKNNKDVFTLKSKEKWNEAVSDDISIEDYGLTAYDYGLVDVMSGVTLQLSKDDLELTLEPVGENFDYTPYSLLIPKDTSFENYPISGTTDNSQGYYYELLSGYLQGYYKLDGFNYEILPERYKNGITIQTLVKIYPYSQGFYFFMGAKAENKYFIPFSGESEYSTTTNIPLTGTTSTGNTIEDDIYGNNLGFFLTEDKRLGYLYIDDQGQIKKQISEDSILNNCIDENGSWVWLSIVFNPYDKIGENDDPDCFPNRLGNLDFYVNNKIFWQVENFEEIIFKGFTEVKEKTVGLPYNISWGGATFGLKNHWHFDPIWELYKDNIFQDASFGDFTTLSGLTDTTEQKSNLLKLSIDETEGKIGSGGIGSTNVVGGIGDHIWLTKLSSLKVYNQAGIGKYIINGKTPTNIVGGFKPKILENQLFFHDTKITLKSGYRYNFSIYIHENHTIFKDKTLGDFKLVFYNYKGDVLYLPFTEISETLTGNTRGNDLNFKKYSLDYQVSNEISTDTTNVSIFADTPLENLNKNWYVYVDNFKIKEYLYNTEHYSQDERKKNLLMEKYFNESFKGGIQKLMIYNGVMFPDNNLNGEDCNNSGGLIYV